MQSPELLPDILFLTAIRPELVDGQLHSPNLASFVKKYDVDEIGMWHAFELAAPDTIEAEFFGKKLADYYFLKTSLALQSKPTPLNLQRFNTATIENDGSPDKQKAVRLIDEDLDELQQGDCNSLVVQTYQALSSASETRTALVEPTVNPYFNAAYLAHYQPITEYIDGVEEGPYTPARLREIFNDFLKILAEDEASWNDWAITNPPKKSIIAVVPPTKEIEVPDGREPVDTKTELLALAPHELMHAEKSVNGYLLGDTLMAVGLPNFIDGEEGLGIVGEAAVLGRIPDKARDRYVDIALASGTFGDFVLTRAQLIDLYVSRENVRADVRKLPRKDPNALLKTATVHVNRIFRGGHGLPLYDEVTKSITQPVYRKDISYFTGYIAARDYINERVTDAESARSLIEYMLKGKFDATKPSHRAYAAKFIDK